MPAQEDISDSTDWLGTPVASLEPLEAGLRCEICKDFYTAPVLTACCHTFCSGCIRRSLSSVNASRKCPLCWAPFDEGQLRKNKIVEELVKLFQAARSDVLALGRAARDGKVNGAEASRKRKLDQIEDASLLSNEMSPRKTRSQTQTRANSIQPSNKLDEIVLEQEEEDDDYEEEQIEDGKVPCPICQQRMPEAQVFTHLDTHSEDRTTRGASTSRLPNRTQTKVHTMNPLPTLSYALLNDMQLRKKLRELGIPAEGNKQIMSRRHTEWRNLVNANCDSSNSKSKSDLLKELNNWERTQNSNAHSHVSRSSKSTVMDKDFDRDNWSTSHNNDFQSLIAAARSKAKSAPKVDHKEAEDDPVTSNQEPAESLKRDETCKDPTSVPSSSQISMVGMPHDEG